MPLRRVRPSLVPTPHDCQLSRLQTRPDTCPSCNLHADVRDPVHPPRLTLLRAEQHLPRAPTGCIGSAMALTLHSGFGELLLPYDIATFSRGFAPLRFALNCRTGAIVVDDSAVSYVGEPSRLEAKDETVRTLIGKGVQEDSLGRTRRSNGGME